MFSGKPKLERLFLSGYKKYGKVSKEYNKRKKLYELLNLLSSLSLSYECKDKKRCIYNLDHVKVAIHEYN